MRSVIMRLVVVVAVVSIFIGAAVGVASAREAVGKVDETAGLVKVQRHGENSYVALKAGMPVHQFDTVTTGPAGRVRLVFSDKSVVSLGPKSNLVISEFVYDPKKKKRKSLLRLISGKVKVFANNLNGYRTKRFDVKSPTAVIGVRGTVFLVWVMSPEETGICALENDINVANVQMPGKKVVLTQGTFNHVKKGQLPEPPAVVPDEIIEKLHQSLFASDRGLTPGVVEE